MVASSQLSLLKCKNKRTKKSALSLGLALPFHPGMQDEKTLQNMLKDSEEGARVMLCGALDPVFAEGMFTRLRNVFINLNYNSHCRSIAVLLTPDVEKVIYLNFPVAPVRYLNKYVSLLELTVNADSQPGFYLLVLEESYARIYEYYHNQLNQVYATKQESCLNEKATSEQLSKQVLQTIERLSGNNERPFFITGNPNLVEPLCNSCYSTIFYKLSETVKPFNEEILIRLVKEIIGHWKYWEPKFIVDRIMITQKSNVLIAEIDMVVLSLRNGVDGLLLIDKRLMQQLFKYRRANALFNTADELMNQVELFLRRGNRVEITEPGLLKEFGEIVLLRHKTPQYFTLSPVSNSRPYNRSDTF